MTETPATPHQKFKFDTEFFELVGDAAAKKPASATPSVSAPPSTANPRQRAFDEGYAAGLKDGQQQAQADLLQLQQHLQNTLIAMQKSLEDREKQLLTQSLGLLRVTLHHLIGHTIAHYPEALLEEHLRNLLPLIKTDESLTLRIHPAARGYHEKLQLPHASIMGLPMHISTDGSLGLTDAVVEWKNGGVESKLPLHLKSIDALLTTAGTPNLPTPALPTAPANPGPAPAQPSLTPPATTTAPAASPLNAAAQAAQSRAAELLGDEELVDALKT